MENNNCWSGKQDWLISRELDYFFGRQFIKRSPQYKRSSFIYRIIQFITQVATKRQNINIYYVYKNWKSIFISLTSVCFEVAIRHGRVGRKRENLILESENSITDCVGRIGTDKTSTNRFHGSNLFIRFCWKFWKRHLLSSRRIKNHSQLLSEQMSINCVSVIKFFVSECLLETEIHTKMDGALKESESQMFEMNRFVDDQNLQQ